jgi:hypothetical protein
MFNAEINQLLANLNQALKRDHYIIYGKLPKVVEKLIAILRYQPYGLVSKISNITGFKERTLYY